MKFLKIFLVINVSILHITFAQKNNCSCAPFKQKAARKAIIDNAKLKNAPYNYIVELQVNKRNLNPFSKSIYYSTASFIDDELLITAQHNVYGKWRIKEIIFYEPSGKTKTKVKKSDLIFYRPGRIDAPDDIAFIKIKNKNALVTLYKGHFDIGFHTNVMESISVNLTGFPCDMPDTLVNKSALKNAIKIHPCETLIGYKLYTCTRDSGAPLWAIINNNPTIIGIHHGGGENYFPNGWNSAAMITQKTIEFINKIKSP